MKRMAFLVVLWGLVGTGAQAAQPIAGEKIRVALGDGPGAKAAKPSGGGAINLKAADSGKTISAGLGDLVIIELDANPTTGFDWEAKPGAKDSALEFKSKEFQTHSQLNPEVRPKLGQGGIAKFTYRVAAVGKAEISLAYRRSWEKTVKPLKTFTVTIEAAEKSRPTVTGKIVFSDEPDVAKISRVEVSIRNTALADGPAPLIGMVELKPPFKLPLAFAVPYDPAQVQPHPMFYSISARVLTAQDGVERLFYINDTRHQVFATADDTKCDIAVKRVR